MPLPIKNHTKSGGFEGEASEAPPHFYILISEIKKYLFTL